MPLPLSKIVNNDPLLVDLVVDCSCDYFPRKRKDWERLGRALGGNTFIKWRRNKRITYTNADVVPYNKYLLFKYNCHINVEYCHSINAIKYQFKYLYKGSDQASVTVESSPSAVEEEML